MMMVDFFNIAFRAASYFDLMLLFGLAGFSAYALQGGGGGSSEVHVMEKVLQLTAVFGALISGVSIFVMAKVMTGDSDFYVLLPQVKILIIETDFGSAWMIRVLMLIFTCAALFFLRKSPTQRLATTVVCSGFALASLAWSGHGAMDEGSRGFWHLSMDILHLLSAASWLGAIAAFGLLLKFQPLQATDRVLILSRALDVFKYAGVFIVLTISVTGVFNFYFIRGLSIDSLRGDAYGILLFLKLILFGVMLGIAALNRWCLSPLLKSGLECGDFSEAVLALRKSMAVDFFMALLVLGLVALLGTLNPDAV
ncbi:copper homeostasis membrane protein CopD [Pseudomonas sp. AP-1]|uniref:copper homeostasis membrane protein CopD n=1 Tax=Pseudomonas sp. AP-1 TaxID=3231718 RepID=UPI0035B1BE81